MGDLRGSTEVNAAESIVMVLDSERDTERLAQALAPTLRHGDVLILAGEVGAGKTTFTRSLGGALNVRAGIISPTFVLVRRHPSLADGPDLVHVDAYRLGSAAEIDDLDLEATLSESVTVVEWGQGRVEHLSDSHLLLEFDRDETELDSGDEAHDDAAFGDSHHGDEAHDDAAAEDEDEPQEQRRVRISATGPRWHLSDPHSVTPWRTVVSTLSLLD